ncbi:hypothetical protein EVAR_19318_1 [Eumeta japonica]|uniref:Uncharacterized protein n=1 Tax=Eumeta variegata TaxID=151549 RepID=A0A4C1UEP7_EUMVA|nr:hypothetical protein EVAR_19318_1 [Eumeta japonica]
MHARTHTHIHTGDRGMPLFWDTVTFTTTALAATNPQRAAWVEAFKSVTDIGIEIEIDIRMESETDIGFQNETNFGIESETDFGFESETEIEIESETTIENRNEI